jgi:replicative superfamily II helicase
VRDAQQHQQLDAAARQLANKQLQSIICAGVGVHHAAMEPDERAMVERLFKEKVILVCSLVLWL